MSHIAFLVEPSYGHVVPTMSLVHELTRQGCRVTYPTTEHFASRVEKTSGAKPIIYQPPEARLKVWREARRADGTYSIEGEGFAHFMDETKRQLNLETSSQLHARYEDDPPHLLVHDVWLQPAAKSLAEQWRIPRALFFPARPRSAEIDCSLALASVPKFFYDDTASLDNRVFFMGFPASGRKAFFEPWRSSRRKEKMILASATTGLLPQTDFFKRVIEALQGCSHQVVLSIGSDVDPTELGTLPAGFEINMHAANFELLEHAHLFIGQGGQGVTLEAIYWGVPQLAIPPGPGHKSIVRRLVDLGLGSSLEVPEASCENLRACTDSMLNDEPLRRRVQAAQALMRIDEVENAARLVRKLL
jgi:UDP:flavonoid glycosyltransferase YjiC (YdhE family)